MYLMPFILSSVKATHPPVFMKYSWIAKTIRTKNPQEAKKIIGFVT
jgi:hypothetical protein